MFSMLSIFGALFVIIFAVAFFFIVAGFWRARGMANKIFTQVERELDRKLSEDPPKTSAATGVASNPEVCSHCGRRVTAKVAQCPNCGAGMS